MKHLTVIMLMSLWILVACGKDEVNTVDEPFNIYIFDDMQEKNISFNQGINSIINDINLDDAVFVIREDDIVEYNWAHQSIKTNNNFGQSTPEYFMVGGYFIVEFNHQRLFGGLLTTDLSAMAIDQPILIYQQVAYRHDPQWTVFGLRSHSSTYDHGPYPFLSQDEAITMRIKEHFRNLDKLIEQ